MRKDVQDKQRKDKDTQKQRHRPWSEAAAWASISSHSICRRGNVEREFLEQQGAGLVIKLPCQQAKGLLLNLQGIYTASPVPAINMKGGYTRPPTKDREINKKKDQWEKGDLSYCPFKPSHPAETLQIQSSSVSLQIAPLEDSGLIVILQD